MIAVAVLVGRKTTNPAVIEFERKRTNELIARSRIAVQVIDGNVDVVKDNTPITEGKTFSSLDDLITEVQLLDACA